MTFHKTSVIATVNDSGGKVKHIPDNIAISIIFYSCSSKWLTQKNNRINSSLASNLHNTRDRHSFNTLTLFKLYSITLIKSRQNLL